MKKIELLVPVGSKDILPVAIANGADAIYLGGKRFGARAFAPNFSEEELVGAIEICHRFGVKVYVTVNTILFNEEMEDVIKYLKFLYLHHVDAVIMQDLGLIHLTRKYIPALEIHVSTQTHNHNSFGIQYFKDLGCTRVVFDRESSLEEITNVNVAIEKEVFVYGALCVSYSGNCLLSALQGGRSANRGMCAGPCRLLYTLIKGNKKVETNYLLSTKTLNTLPHLSSILDANIDSIKIEGRMKSKEYVAAVTSVFRKLINQYYRREKLSYDKEDEKKLLKTYNRQFTEGYLLSASSIMHKEYSNHQGIPIGEVVAVTNKKITIRLTDSLHQEDAIRFMKNQKGMYVNMLYNQKGLLVNSAQKGELVSLDNKERWMYDDLIHSKVHKTIDFQLNQELNCIPVKKLPVTMHFSASYSKEMTLSIVCFDKKVEVKGSVAEAAKNAPISALKIEEQLSKLGNTDYYVEAIEIELEDEIFINIKDLNTLRRDAIVALDLIRKEKARDDFSISLPFIEKKSSPMPKISILVRTEEQLKIALKNNLDYIYVVNEEMYFKYKTYSQVYLRLSRVNHTYKKYNKERLLCTELGSILAYRKKNILRGDYFLNVANDYTLDKTKSLGCSGVTLSVELSKEQLKNIKNKRDSEIIVYGTLEAMLIRNNPLSIGEEPAFLEDQSGKRFPILYEDGFTNVMSATKINKLEHIKHYFGFDVLRIELFDEDIIMTQKIINELKKNML